MRNLVQNVVALTVAIIIFTLILIPELADAKASMDETTALIGDALPIVLVMVILIACVKMISGRSRY